MLNLNDIPLGEVLRLLPDAVQGIVDRVMPDQENLVPVAAFQSSIQAMSEYSDGMHSIFPESWGVTVYCGDRGGNGRNGDGPWPRTDGKGCPMCGAVRGGGHGRGCPHQAWVYDEDGTVICRRVLWPRR